MCVFPNNKLQNRKKKLEKIISFLSNQQKYNFKILRTCSDWSEWFLRRPPIGRIFLMIKNGSKWSDPYFWPLGAYMQYILYIALWSKGNVKDMSRGDKYKKPSILSKFCWTHNGFRILVELATTATIINLLKVQKMSDEKKKKTCQDTGLLPCLINNTLMTKWPWSIKKS